MIDTTLPQNIGGGKQSDRIQWIDYLKGFTILGVIFVHASGHPDWWTANHVNTIFFFMAGMFFKARPFGEFIRRHALSLLLPFIIFFILSYPFRVIVELWDTRSFDAVTWDMIFDIFKVAARSDYLYANVPLWFLLCIFWVQVFYYALSRLPRWATAVALFFIWALWNIISEIPTPFMLNNALCWTLYFGLGNLLGKTISRIVDNRVNATIVIVAGIVIMLLTNLITAETHHAENLFFISWCVVLMATASLLKNAPFLDWLAFFGANTLVILGTHLWILIPLGRVQYLLTRTHSTSMALIITVLCAILMIPTAILINRYFPAAAGKLRRC